MYCRKKKETKKTRIIINLKYTNNKSRLKPVRFEIMINNRHGMVIFLPIERFYLILKNKTSLN